MDDLCISILEFKFQNEKVLILTSDYLCISILEFKFWQLHLMSNLTS